MATFKEKLNDAERRLTAHVMIAATAGTDCAPLVRVTDLDEAQVKRVLDLGAEGIVFPLIRTAYDARKAVASLRYPPHGTREFDALWIKAKTAGMQSWCEIKGG